MIRAAVYARVSSQAQRESQTIESQLRVLPAYVKQQGWELVDTYIDDGRSARAGKLDLREGFARLAKDAKAGRFDVLCVVDIDRLTRTDDMRERAAILGPFQTAGIRIVTPSGGDLDLRTMLGELYVTLQAMFAAEENRKRAERIKRGQTRIAQDGGKPCGRTPYGLIYDRETKTWQLHPGQSQIVRDLFTRALAGESCRAIADDLNARAIAAPAKAWRAVLVWRILQARYPVGDWLANTRQRIVVRVPPIIDERTWQATQDALTERRRNGLRRTRRVYLLEDLGLCSCGSPLFILSGRDREHARYICKARKLNRTCKAPAALVGETDDRIWEAVQREIEDPELAIRLADRAAGRSSNRKAWEKDAAKCRADLSRLTKAEQAFMTRYQRGLISDDALDAQLVTLRKERAQAEEQLAAAERAGQAEESPADPETWLAAMRRLAQSGTLEAQQRVVRAVVKDAVIRDGRVRLTMRLDEVAGALVLRSFRRKKHQNTTGYGVTIRAVA
jgi:site-specific DNA recombinase